MKRSPPPKKLWKPRFDRVTALLALALIALVVVEILFAPHYHPVFPWHHVPGYMAAIGLLTCLVMVTLSKFAGKKLLQRPEEPDDRD